MFWVQKGWTGLSRKGEKASKKRVEVYVSTVNQRPEVA